MVPEDLESFWAQSRAALADVPFDLQCEPVSEPAPGPAPCAKFRLTYRSLGGIPIRAYLSCPITGARNQGPFPAIVMSPGYGGRQFGAALDECRRGFVLLQVYPRSQGESGDLWKVDPSCNQAWLKHGKHSREEFYYRGGYLDLVRGIDCLLTRPDVDPERIGLMGTSQGGGMAIAAGALDRRVKAVVAHVPYLCNFRNNAAYAKFPELANDPAFLNTFDYFDPVNLAPWLRAPTLVSSGGLDVTCPPDAIRSVFDRLPGIKALVHYPDLTHTTCDDFYEMRWEWMRRYLR
jgi:cephalosporin-C deacetylase